MALLELKYSLIDVLYKLITSASIELFCFFNGQTLLRTIGNIITEFLVIMIIDSYENQGKYTKYYFILTLYSCIEAYNYSFVAEPFNSLSISAIDVDIILMHPIFAVQAISAILALVIFVYYIPKLIHKLLDNKFESKFTISIIETYYLIFMIITFNFVFFYINNVIIDFRGKHNQVVFNQMSNELYRNLINILSVSPKVLSFKEPIDPNHPELLGKNKSLLTQAQLKKKRKNLFIMQLESVESQMIDPKSMSYLYNLSQHYQYFNPITSTPYSTWSSTGSILIQCGVPQIVQSVSGTMRKFDGIGYLSKIPCIPDYLQPNGYELYFGIIGPEVIQGLSTWRKAKKYELAFQSNSDPKLFNYINNIFLPKVKDYGRNENDNRRFVGWFFNHDTHKPYEPKSWCTPRYKDQPLWKQCGDCVDQQLQTFVEKFFELKMDETTVLVILSDHITFGNSLPSPHELFMLLPGVKKLPQKHRLPLTYYDVSQTLLDLIGVDQYEPGFIFGNTMFSLEAGQNPRPTNDDFYVLYNFYQNRLQSSGKFTAFHCFDGKKYVYSNRPCNETVMNGESEFFQ